MSYLQFIENKSQSKRNFGFDPTFMPDWMFDFQRYITEKSTLAGRSAIFSDCGCVAGETILNTPDGDYRIDDLAESGDPVRVWSLDEDANMVAAHASCPFIKGVDDLLEVSLSSGGSIRVTANHLFLTDHGWLHASEIREGSRLVSCGSSLSQNEAFSCVLSERRSFSRESFSAAGHVACEQPSTFSRVHHQSKPFRESVESSLHRMSMACLESSLSPYAVFETVTAISYIRTDCFYDINVPEFENYLANGVWNHNTGKTPMQLVWGQNVVEHTNKPVLLLTPLAVTSQTKREADKFGIEASYSGDGSIKPGIVITNYERLHHFDSNQFSGVICDESGILKSYQGETRKAITRFLNKMPYRLLCTATPSPNDFIELGTSSEALGELSYSDMLKRFFRQLDDKGQKKERRQQEDAEALIEIDPGYYQKLSFRVSQSIGQWRLKHHSKEHFWRWVASWSIACRMPSDLGFDDGKFILPELTENDHIITPDTPPPGMLFNTPAIGLNGERAERRRTLTQRCEYVADLVNHDRAAVIWCHMNDEGDRLVETIPNSEQIAGKTPDERKLELYDAFTNGELLKLVIKPKIGAWGLNWEHCNHVVSFASHSYEQHYQAVRRCYRFGQKRPVTVDVIATEGEVRVLANMRRKAKQADEMFKAIVREMNHSERIERTNEFTNAMELPKWL